MSQHVSVYFPTISKDSHDSLVEITVGQLTKDSIKVSKELLTKGKSLDPRLAPLFQHGLSTHGQIAKEMVEYLVPDGYRLSLPKKLELRCNQIANSKTGRSSELALAIRWLLMAGANIDSVICATGSLEISKQDKSVKVGAVCGLQEKMELLLAEREDGEWQDKVTFFIPTHYKVESGKDSKGRSRYDVFLSSQLQPLIDQLEKKGVTVITVSQLSEIFNLLNPIYSVALPSQNTMTFAVALTIALLTFIIWVLQPEDVSSLENSCYSKNASGRTIGMELSPAVIECLVAAEVEKKLAEETKHSSPGDAKTKYNQGQSFYKNKDYKRAFKLFQQAADNELDMAQFRLASMYYSGEGVGKDYVKAAEFYEKAALAGHVRAQFAIGSMYYEGKGIPKNKDEGVAWLTKAKNRRSIEARVMLEAINEKKGLQAPFWEKHLFWR